MSNDRNESKVLTDDGGRGDVGVEEEVRVASLVLVPGKSTHPQRQDVVRLPLDLQTNEPALARKKGTCFLVTNASIQLSS